MLVFIPDIHGEYDLLCRLFDLLGQEWGVSGSSPSEDDIIIFGGDMIDRGPKSSHVLTAIKRLTEEYPKNVMALRGNHETLCLDAYVEIERKGRTTKNRVNPYEFGYDLSESALDLWHLNGGNHTEWSFPNHTVPKEMLSWMSKLPLSIEIDNFFFSHAPVPPEHMRSPENQGLPFTRDELTWTYHAGPEEQWARHHGEGKVGVCGHIHALRHGILKPRFYEHYIFADAGSGCSEKAPLVAINVETRDTLYAWPERMRSRFDHLGRVVV